MTSLKEQEAFRVNFKLAIKRSGKRQKDIAAQMGVTPQDLNNVINGVSKSIPFKGYPDLDSIEAKVSQILGEDYIQHVKE